MDACCLGCPDCFHADGGGAVRNSNTEPDQVRGQAIFAGDLCTVFGKEGHADSGDVGDRVVEGCAGERLDALGYLGATRVGDGDVVGQCLPQAVQRRDGVFGHHGGAAAAWVRASSALWPMTRRG